MGGAVLGALTPFCSCSTIPVLAGLLRSGAPFGPTMAFLFASPLMDPVVLGLLAFVIGLKGAALYAVVTFVASIGMGVLLARLGLASYVKEAAYRSKDERTDVARWTSFQFGGERGTRRGASSFRCCLTCSLGPP